MVDGDKMDAQLERKMEQLRRGIDHNIEDICWHIVDLDDMMKII